jgi:hypothetical protein
MTDLLIRNVDPQLKRELEQRARAHGRTLSDEAKEVLRRGLGTPEPMSKAEPERKFGTWMRSLVRPEDRCDDLVFEYPGPVRNAPGIG